MPATLATAWRPRGEGGRLNRLREQLLEAYERIVVAVPHDADAEAARAALTGWPYTSVVVSPRPFWARYACVQEALRGGGNHVHYADMDLLVHWVEACPDEWQSAAGIRPAADCLIMGRTERALATRPRAIQDTERIINAVFSHVLRRPVDLGLGSRGLSRRAAELILANTEPGGWGDAAWPVLVQRTGWSVGYAEVDGVEWETPDFYQEHAADADARQRAAEAYDQRADRWRARMQTAREIIEEGLAASVRPLR